MHSPVFFSFTVFYISSVLYQLFESSSRILGVIKELMHRQRSVHAAKVNFPQQKGREVYAWKFLLLFSMWSHLQASTCVGMRGWSHVFIKNGFFFAFALGTYLRVCECV